ncbi:putative transcriptional regulator [Chitinophaga terrae (ex Kim and Jung 2007)]|uniref:hypothetical protein n=1 Tax=Chitinophaga terrae (ex Kim and Jung 2007) TaxID=408074 RepID=UPI00278652D3|nr:hypothetical protein [Chitinophaga terrae (ex Kim and Jung 2007)]MDQ0110225.1 putative transcriptional regulator [Chitinophaga terrae (ex Kim and Jung 2007)]
MTQDNLNNRLPEHESWNYILRVIEDETIFFKTKLACILSNDFEKSHLGNLEIFQYRFLKMDEQVILVRHELREFQDILRRSSPGTATSEAITRLRNTLEMKIDKLQESFDVLASDFRMYMHSFPGD